MTRERLIEEAAKLDGWHVTSEGFVRRAMKEEECPVIAVANAMGADTDDEAEAAGWLGLHSEDMEILMDAADGARTCDWGLRERLLAIVKDE